MNTTPPNPPPPTPAAPPRYGRYLLGLFLLALLLYPLPFLLIRAPHFERWSTSPYGRDLEYGMTATHVDADVLIYGDSSAYFGLDPRQISAALGLKVFNLPNLLPSLRVNDDLALRRYLAHNKPPRLIVFYFTPWDLDYTVTHSTDALYDGTEMLLRHGTAADLDAFARRHPADLLQFPFQFYRINSLRGLPLLLHPAPPSDLEATLGHRDIPPYEPLAADCKLPPARANGRLGMDTVSRLLGRYNKPPLRAIVYIAPVPGCAGTGVVLANDFGRLGAAPPVVVSPEVFVRDGYYAHPLVGGVARITAQLTEALRRQIPAPSPGLASHP